MIYLLPTIPLILLIVAVILRRWRTGVVLLFAWLIIEDVIRRLVPGQPGQIMLIKDALIFLTYFSFFAAIVIKGKKIWKPPFIVFLFLFAAFSLINAFNPHAPNLLFGIIGLRSYLWYMPLAFLGYYMFTSLEANSFNKAAVVNGGSLLTGFGSQEKLLKFCRILAYLAVPLFIFAAFQYAFYGIDSALMRPFASSHQYHSFGWVETGMVPLVSSVFGTAHRFARFLMLLFFVGIGLLSVKKSNLLIISVVFAFLGIILSGSRSALVLTVAGAVLFFLFAKCVKNGKVFNLWKNNRVKIFAAALILLLAFPIIFLAGDIGLFGVSAFYYAFQQRIPWMIQEFSRAFSEANFFGAGTGTMSQGLEYIPGGAEWIKYQTREARQGFWFETGVGKILFELGIAGLFIFYLFWASLLYKMKKEINKLKDSGLRNLGLSIFIFSFLMLIWFSGLHHQIFGDATTLVILWFFVGVLFSLRRLKNYQR